MSRQTCLFHRDARICAAPAFAHMALRHKSAPTTLQRRLGRAALDSYKSNKLTCHSIHTLFFPLPRIDCDSQVHHSDGCIRAGPVGACMSLLALPLAVCRRSALIWSQPYALCFLLRCMHGSLCRAPRKKHGRSCLPAFALFLHASAGRIWGPMIQGRYALWPLHLRGGAFLPQERRPRTPTPCDSGN
ncbi:hypothetical protein BKA63DRAFT_243441 [Paraphoma chrysanthemicola]|nr:hypothetical protein BKA63DRAFT_243441 [Paraphoma chrysanthemicola]